MTLYDTNGTTVLGTGIADATGAWSIVSSTLSAGARTVTTRQVDLAGNASGASAGLSLTIDTAAPTFSKALAVNEGFATLSIDGATLAGAAVRMLVAAPAGMALALIAPRCCDCGW